MIENAEQICREIEDRTNNHRLYSRSDKHMIYLGRKEWVFLCEHYKTMLGLRVVKDSFGKNFFNGMEVIAVEKYSHINVVDVPVE